MLKKKFGSLGIAGKQAGLYYSDLLALIDTQTPTLGARMSGNLPFAANENDCAACNPPKILQDYAGCTLTDKNQVFH